MEKSPLFMSDSQYHTVLLVWSAKRLQCNQQILFHKMHWQQTNSICDTSSLQNLHIIIYHLCFKKNQNWHQTRKLWVLITKSVFSVFQHGQLCFSHLNSQLTYSFNELVLFVLLLQILREWFIWVYSKQNLWLCKQTYFTCFLIIIINSVSYDLYSLGDRSSDDLYGQTVYLNMISVTDSRQSYLHIKWHFPLLVAYPSHTFKARKQ